MHAPLAMVCISLACPALGISFNGLVSGNTSISTEICILGMHCWEAKELAKQCEVLEVSEQWVSILGIRFYVI